MVGVIDNARQGGTVVQTASRIAVALCLCLAASAQSTTWYVEKDGSGDFEVIQDAVDAAAPGDVIMVGPGRYAEFQLYNFGYGDWHIYVMVETDDLTIIGSGPESTIIGPVDDSVNIPNTAGVVNHYMPQFRMEQVAVENMRKYGIEILEGGLTLVNCIVQYTRRAVFGLFAGGLEVFDCEFTL